MYSFFANFILFVHICFVAIVIFGLIFVLIGVWRSWAWVYNPWFRWGHVLMICIVAVQSWFGITCPLTTFESYLRRLAGENQYHVSFIAYWMDKILFYQGPEWVFTLIYSLFFLLVLTSFLKWPPKKFTN